MILDTNQSTTAKLDQLKSLGYTHLIRYIATGYKSIKAAEARAIANAGIFLATVYEAWGDTRDELNGSLGASHAQQYLKLAPDIGQPEGSGAYFAVDNDESASDIRNRILPYFRAIKDVIGDTYRIGVYGSGNVCAAMLDAGLCELSWLAQSTGWAGYQSFKDSGRWNILQHMPKILAGLDTDPDEINPLHPNIGAFTPFGALEVDVPVPPVHDVTWLQQKLNEAGANPPLTVDGRLGPRTLAAMIAYMESKQT